jgi:formate-nitrite transporter family protein
MAQAEERVRRDAAGDDGEPTGFTEQEAEEIEESSRLRAPLIYEVVRREGEEEMQRPSTSLWWSGCAAGLSISFSLVAQAILRSYLPDAPWRHRVASLGYTVGFLMVVLARQQLFTENTITVVLPVAVAPTLANFGRLLRIWSIVFAANMVGSCVAAAFWRFAPVVTPDLQGAMLEISRAMVQHSWPAMFVKGIPGGFLIAAMVWLIPSAEGAQFSVIVLMSYLIAAGNFTHVVAGGVEAFMLLLAGQLGFGAMLASFAVPVLLGNVIGGTLLFALISYAQIMKEV